MSIGVLQERQTSAGGANVNSISLAYSSNLTAGSAQHGLGAHADGGSPTLSFTDTNSNNWGAGALDLVDDTVGGIKLFQQAAQNATAAACTVQITFTGTSVPFPCIWIKEIGQATTTGNPDGHNSVTNASTTSQNLTATNTNQPALVSVLSCNANTLEVPSLDATYTASSQNPGWNFGGGTSATIAGHKRVTSATSQSVTNTQASADALTTLMMIFTEAAGVVTFPPVPEPPQLQPQNNTLVRMSGRDGLPMHCDRALWMPPPRKIFLPSHVRG